MSENNEIIVVNNNEEYPFERVNFDDSISILTYGSEILNQIKEKSIVHAKMLEDQGVTDSLDDELDSIKNFSRQIRKVELIDGENKEEKGLMKIGSKIVDKFRRKAKEFLDVNFIGFEKYQSNLQTIATVYGKDRDLLVKTVKQNSSFAKEIEKLAEQLKLLKDVGQEDLEEYKNNVFEPRRIAYEANPEDVNIRREYFKTKIIKETFEATLEELKKGLAATLLTLTDIETGNQTNSNLIMQYNSYLGITQPFLYLQGAALVEKQRQRDRLNKFNRVVAVTNDVFVKNAELLVDNVKDGTELRKNGSLLMETIEKVLELTNEGLELYLASEQEIQSVREKNLENLNIIIEQADVARQRIEGISLDNKAIETVYQKPGLPKTRTRKRGQ